MSHFLLVKKSEIILLVLRIWKWFDVQKVTAASSLNFVTQSGLVVLHFGLIVTDISTIYFEVNMKNYILYFFG